MQRVIEPGRSAGWIAPPTLRINKQPLDLEYVRVAPTSKEFGTVAPASSSRQHLIDPEICIRCNTCEATCPIEAITHDSRNYVVDCDLQWLQRLHLAVPYRRHRQLARGGAHGGLHVRRAARLGHAARAGGHRYRRQTSSDGVRAAHGRIKRRTRRRGTRPLVRGETGGEPALAPCTPRSPP